MADIKNIRLQKKIGEVIYDIMPETIGSVVKVTDPMLVDGEADSAILNTVLADIATTARKGVKKIVYKANALHCYLAEDADATTDGDIVIDLPAEQFLDQATTEFITAFDLEAYKAAHTNVTIDEATSALNGKPVLVLGLKTIARNENGLEETTISASAISIEDLITTYTGVAATATNPVGITISEAGEIAGSLAIKEDAEGFTNALKLDAEGKLYVDDVSIQDGTENAIVTQDADGKLINSGIILANEGEVLPTKNAAGDSYTSVLEALNDLTADVAFGSDGQIALLEKVDSEGTTYDYYWSLDHVNVSRADVETTPLAEGEIVTIDANGKIIASGINVSSLNSSEVVEGKIDKVVDATEDNIATLTAEGKIKDSGIAASGTINVYTAEDLANGTPRVVGQYNEAVGQNVIAALNEVKTVADTALANRGAMYFVEKDGSLDASVVLTEYDLIMQEI